MGPETAVPLALLAMVPRMLSHCPGGFAKAMGGCRDLARPLSN